MSTNLTFRSLRPLHRQCLNNPAAKRSFSATPIVARRRSDRVQRTDPVAAGVAARQQEGKYSGAMQQEQLNDERNVPDDIGLIPGTFVHAPLFPLTQFSLSERLWYEWKWIRSRAASWFQLRRFRQSFKWSKPRVYWSSDRGHLKYIAVQKYKHLYESFAKADSTAISQLCASGVAKEFQKRLETRPSSVQMRWAVLGEPKCSIVSNIASPLSIPGYEETGIHQVTFHIRSNQKITLGSKGIDKVSSTTSPDVNEYLVMQRQFVRGSAKEWKIWGFTEFSTAESIEKDEEYAREVNAYQAA